MSITVDALKEASIAGVSAGWGKDVGQAYGLLMFGGYGFAGVVDGATLAAKADTTAAQDLTQDLAISLVADSAKAGLAAGFKYILTKMAADPLAEGAVEAAELTADVLSTASVVAVTGIFESKEAGPEPPAREQQPIPGPPQPPPGQGLVEQPQPGQVVQPQPAQNGPPLVEQPQQPPPRPQPQPQPQQPGGQVGPGWSPGGPGGQGQPGPGGPGPGGPGPGQGGVVVVVGQGNPGEGDPDEG